MVNGAIGLNFRLFFKSSFRWWFLGEVFILIYKIEEKTCLVKTAKWPIECAGHVLGVGPRCGQFKVPLKPVWLVHVMSRRREREFRVNRWQRWNWNTQSTRGTCWMNPASWGSEPICLSEQVPSTSFLGTCSAPCSFLFYSPFVFFIVATEQQ